MNLQQVLNELNLPDEVMNEKILWVPVKPSYSSGIIHPNGFMCSSFVTFSEENRLHYEKIYDEAFLGKFSGYEALSFNEFLAASKNYCSKCSFEAYIKCDDLVSSYDIFNVNVFLKNIEDKKARLLQGSSPFFLTDWRLLNVSSSLDSFMKSFPSLNSLNEEVSKHIHESLFADETAKLTFRAELSEFVSSKLVVFSDVKDDASEAALHAIMVECKNKIKDELLTNESFVVFNSNFLDDDKVRNFLNKDVSRHLLAKVILNPVFKVGSFSVLPYLEFQFLKQFVKPIMLDENKYLSNVYIASKLPSEYVFETVESLYDKSNETMSKLQNLFEIAESI